MVAELLIQILILTVLAILTALAVILWMLWGLRTQQQQTRVVSFEGFEAAEQENTVTIDLTAGGKKLIRFIPLNKFGAPSAWDTDGLPKAISSEGPATFEPVTADFAGEPFPPDQIGQWFLLASHGSAGATTALFEGDGHVEAEGEEELVKTVSWTVEVNAVAADVESVTIEESEEIPE